MLTKEPAVLVIATHPVQYHAPVYRALETEFGLSVAVIYGSDFSIAGYFDTEFRTNLRWDTELVRSGDPCIFLSRVSQGGPASVEKITAKGLGEALDGFRPSTVLLAGYRHPLYLHAFHEARRRKWPILLRAETTDHAHRRKGVNRWVRTMALRRLYARCAMLLPIGIRSRAHYLRLGCPEQKLVFSPYCVDTSNLACDETARATLRPVTRRALGIEDHKVVLLFSGKLSPRKGVLLLVEAVKGLPQELRDRLVLLFLGDGEQRARIEAAMSAPQATAGRVLGFKNQTQLSPYYHASDLLVLPSIEGETWGLVVNEALHHGVPCVVSDGVGCAPDLVEPGVTGAIAEAGSAPHLRSAIVDALKLTGRPDTRERCRGKAGEYTVSKAAAGIARAVEAVQAFRSK